MPFSVIRAKAGIQQSRRFGSVSVVMAALDAAIQGFTDAALDGRVKPGHDKMGPCYEACALIALGVILSLSKDEARNSGC
jgi:hypothetical protein